jgi:predicted nucleotidyltransferase
MNREDIINKIRQTLEPLEFVYAMWLEGSDANGHLDEYSDIDINVDVEDEQVEQVFEIVEGLFELDFYYDNSGDNKQKQKIYHVKGTGRYLMIDFNLQPHSSNSSNSTFAFGDTIDVCKVLFDKAVVIRYVQPDTSEYKADHQYWLKESGYRFSQIDRVHKYVLRNQYPEAFIYYNKYVIEPIVFLLRMKYTPAKLGYYMVHISQHIPEYELVKLNRLLQVQNVESIGNNLEFAKAWYNELTRKNPDA